MFSCSDLLKLKTLLSLTMFLFLCVNKFFFFGTKYRPINDCCNRGFSHGCLNWKGSLHNSLFSLEVAFPDPHLSTLVLRQPFSGGGGWLDFIRFYPNVGLNL